MKTRKILLITFVMLIGLGGYFTSKTVANSSTTETSGPVTLKGVFGHDETSAWCEGTNGKCATIAVVGEEIMIFPSFAPGEYDSKLASFVITEQQLATLQSGGTIALPPEVLD